MGHVQRGGTPSAYDRILGARMGCEAVLALMMHPNNTRPFVIGINGNQTSYIPLEESVEKTQAIAKAIKDKDFTCAVELRGPSFKRNLETYLRMSKLESPSSIKRVFSSQIFDVRIFSKFTEFIQNFCTKRSIKPLKEREAFQN